MDSAAARRQRLGVLAPFLLITLLPVPVAAIGGISHGVPFVVFLLLTAVSAASIVLVPWERMPTWPQVVPGALFCVAVAFAREANDGAASGLSLLLLLPVLWQALYGERRMLHAALVCTTATLVLPIVLFGAPHYPPESEWSRTVVWLMVAPIAGSVVHRLVDQQRAGEETLTRIAHVAHEVTANGDNRESICRAAMEVADADVAYILEPAGDRLVSTAVAGVVVPALDIPLTGVSSQAVDCYRSGTAAFVRHAAAAPACQPVVQETGVASAHYQPVLRNHRVVGILIAGWLSDQRRLSSRAETAMRLLGAEAGVAMERAEQLSTASRLARLDPLTGLPNRRSWDEEAGRSLANRRRGGPPLCLAIVDIDHFKQYNDTHGHQAGDLLLKEAAAAWQGVLRAGDLIARWGGEEFAVLLPMCTADDAVAVLERVRATTPRGQTCSVGVVEVSADDTLYSAVEGADEALYEAKSGGRDRTVAGEPGDRERQLADVG